MNIHPVKFFTTEAVENEFFSFICRHCERQLWGDYAMPNSNGRYENLCISCGEEMRATVLGDMKAIREAVAQINS